MTNQNNSQSLPTILVQHDDAFVDIPSHPYHTRFFDVVVVTSPSVTSIASTDTVLMDSPETQVVPQQRHIVPGLMSDHANSCDNSNSNKEKIILERRSSVSIISYEIAIINAIIELRDLHIGSSTNAIKKYMKDKLINDATTTIATATCLSDNDNNGSGCIHFYKNRMKNSLFLAALKSLLDDKVIVPHEPFMKKSLSTCRFKLSRDYINERFRILRQNHTDFQYSIISKNEKEKETKKKHKKYKTGKKQVIPTVRFKPPLSKIRLVDQNAGGVLVEKKKKNDVDIKTVSGMDLDDEMQQKCTLLVKLGLGFNQKVFIAKRRNLRKKINLTHGKIVSTSV